VVIFAFKPAIAPAVLGYFFDQFDEAESGRTWSVGGMVSTAGGIVAPTAGGVMYRIDPRSTFPLGGALTSVGAAVAVTLTE
jgi:MFS family permease